MANAAREGLMANVAMAELGEEGSEFEAPAKLLYYEADSQEWRPNSKDAIPRTMKFEMQERNILGRDDEHRNVILSLTPTSVKKIDEPELKLLCIEHERDKQAHYLFLDFSNTEKGRLNFWEKALNEMMGHEMSSEMRDRLNTAPTAQLRAHNHHRNVKSALVSSLSDLETKRLSSLSLPRSLSSLPENCTLPNSIVTLQCERDEGTVEKEFEKKELGSLQLANYMEEVYVSSINRTEENATRTETPGLGEADGSGEIPGSGEADDAGETPSSKIIQQFHIGDKILGVNSIPVLGAQGALAKIRSMPDDQEMVTVKLQRFPHGCMCIIAPVKDWDELGISLNNNEITEMIAGLLVRNACDPKEVMFDQRRCRRAVTSVNDRPVTLTESSEEVKQIIEDSLQDYPLVLHLHPITFLRALEKGEVSNYWELEIKTEVTNHGALEEGEVSVHGALEKDVSVQGALEKEKESNNRKFCHQLENNDNSSSEA